MLSKRGFFLNAAAALTGISTAWGAANRFFPAEQTTPQFNKLQQVYPWLEKTQKSVGWLYAPLTDGERRGSAVLLDSQGALALCSHEMTDSPAFIRFSLPAGGISEKIPVQYIDSSIDQDMAFAQIAPEMVAKYQLAPVAWGPVTPAGENAVVVGFPGHSGLDAVEGAYIDQTKPYYPLDSHGVKQPDLISCNKKLYGQFHRGISGGGVFDQRKGQLIGILKASRMDASPAYGQFTPIEAVWAAYTVLFPERAAQTSRTADVAAQPLDPACRINRRNFFSLNN